MSDLQVMTNERLHKLIAATQETLNELKDEVERRQEVAQEREIHDLDRHMENAELGLEKIRDFIAMLVGEWKKDSAQR